MSERDQALEEAARWIEDGSIADMRGIMARKKRDREDANLRHETRVAMRKELAKSIRDLKERRQDDALEVLKQIHALDPSKRHDHYLRDAWPLAWKGLVDITATITTNSNQIPPETKYRILLTERGLKALGITQPASEAPSPIPQAPSV